jgi:hypothetical protein
MVEHLSYKQGVCGSNPHKPTNKEENVDDKRSKKIEDFLRKEHSPKYIDLVDLLDDFYDEVFDEIYSVGYDDGYSRGIKGGTKYE